MSRRRLGWSLVSAGLLLAMAVPGAQAQEPAPAVCDPASSQAAEAGWALLREGDLDGARGVFEEAIELCGTNDYARVGLGYADLRSGEDEQARVIFLDVVERDPGQVDALSGLGILAWRRGDLESVQRWFLQVEEADPGNALAADYLARVPDGIGEAPERPELVRPDTAVVVARTAGERIQIRTADGWQDFYVKGVNLGAALPGRFPSEFPEQDVYATWLAQMAEMGTNTVRVYTIHPPGFYDALREWNEAHPDQPLYLIHGVWTELPHDGDYLGEEFEAGFFGEMERVVDVIHGRADIPPKPGNASGFYTSNVSEWTAAWIIGREWEPFSSMAFDSIHPDFTSWEGRYVSLPDGNPMEAWLAKAVDHMVSYEVDVYNVQRPVAYTNWPTLDPMVHPTETTREEELAIRRALGESIDRAPREYDNDILGLDATLMTVSEDFQAGVFASFHAYPYYPDFMVLEPGYAGAESSFGPSRYFGYLEQLKEAHPGMPLLISEYGVPTSHGPAHLQPEGMHHGGHTEAAMAEINRRLTVELAEVGMAGGALFAWIDEWFKKNWLVIEFEIPEERNRLWMNRLDAEQRYGVFALAPEPPVPGADMAERAAGWADVAPVLSRDGVSLRAAADAEFLWLRVDGAPRSEGGRTLIGVDVIDPELGDRRWPGGGGDELPVGLEFVIAEDDAGVRVVVDPPVNPWRYVPEGEGSPARQGDEPEIAAPPPDLQLERIGQRTNLPLLSTPNADGVYEALRVIPNRRRFGRDSLEYRALSYDRGVLPRGPLPDGMWERDGDALEIRVPWMLINVADPSSRSVLSSPTARAEGYGRTPDKMVRLPSGEIVEPDTLMKDLWVDEVDDIGLVLGLDDGAGSVVSLAGDGAEVQGSGRFTWPTWEAADIRWTTRARPLFQSMQDAFRAVGYDMPPGGFAAEPESGLGPEPGSGPELPQPSELEAALAAGAAAWDAGELDDARAAYERILELAPDYPLALHRLGLMRAWAEDYDGALVYLDRLVEVDPENVGGRVDRARVHAWSGDTGTAVAQLDALLEERPGEPAALEARATFLSWEGDLEGALEAYDALLAVSPDPSAIRLRQAQVLSWAGDFQASRSVYDSVLARDPDDVDARLGLARVLTFAGETAGAVAEYETILDVHPANVQALQGMGRAQSWGGQLVAGEQSYRRAVAADVSNPASLTGLAQNLRWQGRNAAALEVLQQARAVAPADADVQEQLRWVNTALGTSASTTVAYESDSDDNAMFTTSAWARTNPVPRLSIRADIYRRDLSQSALGRVASGLTLTASWHFEPGWVVSAGAGGGRNNGSVNTSQSAWRIAVATPGRYAVNGTVTAAREVLDATALLAENSVAMTQLNVDGRWTPAPLWRVSGGVGLANFQGSEDNRRTNLSIAVTRRLGRPWTVGASLRTFGFEKNLSDGYFDPDRYILAELPVRWLRELGRWTVTLEGAPGTQRVGSQGAWTGALRASLRGGLRLAPGRELSLSVGRSTAGMRTFRTSTAAYSYTAVVLAATWVF